MKAAASLALLATLASACTLSRPARTAVIVSGAALTMGGIAIVAGSDVDADNNGYNENPLDDDLDAAFGGAALVGLGVLLVVAGAVADAPVTETTAVAPIPSPTPPMVTWAPPSLAVPSRAPLPEVATDDVVLRMAQQARAAVERGRCDAAWSTWAAMNARDARYAAAIAAGPVFAPCPRTTAVRF